MSILGCLGTGLGTFKNPFAPLFTEVRPITTWDDVVGCHTIVLWGGVDISPALYGQKANRFCQALDVPSRRDILEWGCLQTALNNDVNIIGICRGAQLLSVFSGGSLAQDISFHQNGHNVVTSEGEIFHTAGDHHQMMLPNPETSTLLAGSNQNKEPEFYIGPYESITTLPPGFKVPEAVYFHQINALGFQWHPEWMAPSSRGYTYCVEKVSELFLK